MVIDIASIRASGVLLHPTCLPGRFGIGDLGPEAYRFVDWLSGARQQFWQILPVNPTDDDGSPYRSPSAFAGNTLLVSPERLVDDGLLSEEDLGAFAADPPPGGSPADFSLAARAREVLLEQARARLGKRDPADPLLQAYGRFCHDRSGWLDAYAQYLALREANGRRAWTEWTEYVEADKRPSRRAAAALAERIETQKFRQFLFFRQWEALRRYGRSRGVRIIGDLPIYVAHDSADVWANRRLFLLDEWGRPILVAGVPPDYFQPTGQLWHNPVYRWDVMAREGFGWWIERFEAVADLVDLVRVDHFRGYEAYWAVPAGDETARHGRWIEGPGAALFQALGRRWASRQNLAGNGEVALPIIAEDLGEITPPVIALRDRFRLPGMAVLQFAFAPLAEEHFLPDRIDPRLVVYPGTHDNDTTRGWLVHDVGRDPYRLGRLRQYASGREETIAWEMIELAWKSAGWLAVATLQDLLSLDSSARMNTPGEVSPRNWRWRFAPSALSPTLQARLADLTVRSNRAREAPLT